MGLCVCCIQYFEALGRFDSSPLRSRLWLVLFFVLCVETFGYFDVLGSVFVVIEASWIL